MKYWKKCLKNFQILFLNNLFVKTLIENSDAKIPIIKTDIVAKTISSKNKLYWIEINNKTVLS